MKNRYHIVVCYSRELEETINYSDYQTYNLISVFPSKTSDGVEWCTCIFDTRPNMEAVPSDVMQHLITLGRELLAGIAEARKDVAMDYPEPSAVRDPRPDLE